MTRNSRGASPNATRTNPTSIPRIVLIGDSIRMGYQPVVARELQGVATVWGPSENCGTSLNILEHINEWITNQDASLFHVNCGLHDLKRPFGASTPTVPPAEYQRNVEQILQTALSKWPGRVVWATTTPVNEKRHHETKDFDRFESDVALYNRIAMGVCRKLGVPVNNLFAVVQQTDPDKILATDGVHFTPEGYELLGKAVAGFVRRRLKPTSTRRSEATPCRHTSEFCTAINCMDGRLQLPVIAYLQRRFGVRYVDNITEAGPNRILAERRPIRALERIMRRVRISIQKHGSQHVAIVGHWDCGGNPACKSRQLAQLQKAARFLRQAFPKVTVISLWVNEKWQVTETGARSSTPRGCQAVPGWRILQKKEIQNAH